MNVNSCRILSCFILLSLAGCVGVAAEGANMTKDQVVYKKYLDAAKDGDAKAEYKVGDALCCSIGDRQGFYDTRQSVAWLCRASRQGYALASRKLGQIYAGDTVHGLRLLRRIAEGVAGHRTDLPVSYAWYRVAAAQGSKDASTDATTLWDDFDNDQKARARTLLSDVTHLPCRWDEVFKK